MTNSNNTRLLPLRRLVAAQTLPGRWWLNLDVHCRRWLRCHVPDAGGMAKRFLDVVGGGFFFLLSLPVFLLAAVLIKLEDGGPVIFAQIRVGQFGREFKMYKFRSMVQDAEARLENLLGKNRHREGITFKIKDDPRLTRVGKWLRKFSFDELPQFFNVLKGDMSLVGPRPPLPREVAQYSLADRRRLAGKPGLTCFWQISGRSEIDFSGQVKLDVQYLETRSLAVDIKIIAKTAPAVLAGKGAC